ncbi:MAG: hypothetical protein WA797_06185 [Acidimicrobiales bacterium]
MRRILVVLLGSAVAALSSVIVGEYELVGATPYLAGAILGGLLGELFLGLGRWRGVVPGAIAAVLAAGSMYWSGQVNANFGIDPYPAGAYVGAGVASLVALVRVWRAAQH